MRTIHKLLLLLRNRGAASLYLLQDLFTNALSAGAVNGTLATDGVNTRTVTDTNSQLSLAGGEAVFAGAAAVTTWGDPGIVYPQMNFASQSVLEFIVEANSLAAYTARIGFKSGASLFADVSFIALNQTTFSGGGVSLTRALNTPYTVRVISTIEYSFLLIKGGVYTSWQLFGLTAKNEPTMLYPAITNNSGIFSVDEFALYGTSGWGDLGAYTGYSADASGAITGSADGFTSVIWQPQSAETLELVFRQTDADNKLLLRCDQAAGTIKLYKVEATVETELTGGTTTQTWSANGTSYTIVVYLNGTTILVLVNGSAKNSTTSSFSQAATGVSVSGGGWVRNLIAWPLTYSDSFISRIAVQTQRTFLAIGDSKTAGSGDISPNYAYMPFVARAINARELPEIAAGGRNTATLEGIIDAELASQTGTPDYVLYNMGRNDIGAVQATWEADTAYIFDAIHTKWPNAHIYAMRVAAEDAGDEAWLTNMRSTYLPNVLATRSSWAHLGPDESVFLAANWDRYAPDGTHPSHEGYILTAQQWVTVLGL